MNWLEKLGEYAPDIVAAVMSGGATLPALAVKAVSDALDVDVEKPEQLTEVIKEATPAQLEKLKVANRDYLLAKQRLDNELKQSEMQDTQHARQSHKHHWMPSVLTLLLVIMVCGMFWVLAYEDVKSENTLYLLVGQIMGAFATAITFWLGSSRSSQEKSQLKPG